MTKVKICGLKSLEDVIIVNTLKPDYAGFVFAESKRKVTIDEGREYSYKLNNCIKRVGVFVNQGKEYVNKCIEECNLDVIQLHGDENYSEYKDLPVEIWKGFRIKDLADFGKINNYSGEFFLTDSYVEGIYGGTGKTLDHSKLKVIDGKKHIIAGGLTKDNVMGFIEKFNPYCVDVSSSVENNGKKDFFKVKEFIKEVRNYGK